MEPPSVVLTPSTAKVRDFRGTTNANLTALAAAIGEKVTAWSQVDTEADLVTLVDATYLDCASTLDGSICMLLGDDPTIADNWRTISSTLSQSGDGINVTSLGVEPDTGDDQRANIIAAIAVASEAKRPLFFPGGTYTKVGAAIPLPSNIELVLAPDAIIKNASGATAGIFTNADHVSGNVNIRITGGVIDGNKEQSASGNTNYSTIYFVRVKFGSLTNCHVRGAVRKELQSTVPLPGMGAELERCEHFHVLGGKYYENHYDGVLFRGSRYCSLIGASGYNNSSALCQVSRTSDGNDVPSQFITIVGCDVEHTTGVVEAGSQAPFTRGFAVHHSDYVIFANNVVYGTVSGVDILDRSNGCIVENNVFSCRYSANRAFIDLWFFEYGVNRNQVKNNTLVPIDGANHRFIRVQGDYNTIEGNKMLAGGGTGTWTMESDGAYNHFVNNDSELPITVSTTTAESGTVQGRDDGLVLVKHGANSAYTRPITQKAALWLGSVKPTQRRLQDAWIDGSGVTHDFAVDDLLLDLNVASLSALANNAAVSAWVDSSVNARNAAQATGANQPLYQTSGINGRPAVFFDGTNDQLSIATGLDIMKNMAQTTVFAVIKPADVSMNRFAFFVSNGLSGSSARLGLSVGLTSGVQSTGGRRLDADSFATVASGTITAGQSFVHEVVADWSAATLLLYRAGVLVNYSATFQTAGSTSNSDSVAMTVGGANGTLYFSGHIGRIMVFNRRLAAAERKVIRDMLNAQFAIV